MPIDLYCERTSAAWWAEPGNALANFSFLAAAWAIVLLIRRTGARVSAPVIVLTVSMVCIGVGSFLFHTDASQATMLADVVPILIYQIAFLFSYLHRVAGLRLWRVAVVLGLLLLVSAGFGLLPRAWLNGSLAYGAAVLFVSAIGAYHYRMRKGEPAIVLLAAAVFVVSLVFRSMDLWVCAVWPLGTHFMWHVLNGLVLYLTTRAYVLNQPQRVC